MQIVILAGGKGSRISEETVKRPKPMVTIGDIPIIIHVMDIFAKYNFKDFIISSGFMSNKIENFFTRAKKNKNKRSLILSDIKKYNINVINTGIETNTAGRILNLKKYLKNDFFFTYADGLADINILKLLKTYMQIKKKKKSLITIANPISKYGIVETVDDRKIIKKISEKSKIKNLWVNIGFGIFQKKFLQYIKKPQESLELDVLPRIAKKTELFFYKHKGNFKAMDSLKDKIELEKLYSSGVWFY
jgi:glucose-1-phosphate cytidylyltransferase